MSSVFEAVAEQTRRRILEALHTADAERSVTQLVEQLELSQPTVSKHLKVLRDQGLVSVREEGQRRFYRIDVTALEPVREWIDGLFPPEPSHPAAGVSEAGAAAAEAGPATETTGAAGAPTEVAGAPAAGAEEAGVETVSAHLPHLDAAGRRLGRAAATITAPVAALVRRVVRPR